MPLTAALSPKRVGMRSRSLGTMARWSACITGYARNSASAVKAAHCIKAIALSLNRERALASATDTPLRLDHAMADPEKLQAEPYNLTGPPVVEDASAAELDLRSQPDRRSFSDRRSPIDRRSSSDRVSTPPRRSLPDRRPSFNRRSSLVIAASPSGYQIPTPPSAPPWRETLGFLPAAALC
jgi:hypothetical protein